MIPIITAIFLLATLVNLSYWIIPFRQLAQYKVNPDIGTTATSPPVSIIICARNEADNLRRHLPRILDQDYRSYEVLVVNDNSLDNSSYVLSDIQKNHPNFRIINNYNNNKQVQSGKKTALALGIAQAKNDILLLTDADCQPESREWLQRMVNGLGEEKKISLGYGPLQQRKGFLNKITRYETVYTAIQYLSLALSGFPYMGVGRNLAYTKDLFHAAGGFKSHEDLASGDDDLFINQVATKENTQLRLHPATFIYSAPKNTWREWVRQKRRHLTTGSRYQWQHQVLLGILTASHVLHYLGGGILLFFGSPIIIFITFTVRMVVVMTICSRILKKLAAADLLVFVPLLDAALALYYVLFAPIVLLGKPKPNAWK